MPVHMFFFSFLVFMGVRLGTCAVNRTNTVKIKRVVESTNH